jgi:hypothetical protein
MAQNDLYTSIRRFGAATLIPFVLIAGPLAGYMVGSFVQEEWSQPFWVLLLFVAGGLITSCFEVYRILKYIMKDLSEK